MKIYLEEIFLPDAEDIYMKKLYFYESYFINGKLKKWIIYSVISNMIIYLVTNYYFFNNLKINYIFLSEKIFIYFNELFL